MNQAMEQMDYLEFAPNIPSKGELIEGTVITVDKQASLVWLDLSAKASGKVDLAEFETPPAEGETILVKVVNPSDPDGVLVSKRQADSSKMRKVVEDAYEKGEIISGKVTKKAKNGLKVDFSGIEAYVPLSHMDLGRIGNQDDYIGQTYDFKIIKLEKRGKNLSMVVSRKDLLEKDREEKSKAIFEAVKVGDVVAGIVKNITRFGIFVDIGGMDGLIAHEDISWQRGSSAKDIVQPGDQIEVKVTQMDQERQRIGLSLKALQGDPLNGFCEKHAEGEILEGKVVKLETFGAFVELEPGVEGLLHVSELSWTRRINHPKEVLQVGSTINVKLLKIDHEARRISLGYRQLLQNPYDSIDVDYPLGSRHTGQIMRLTEFGVFVKLPTDIEGLVRKEDISWEKKEGDVLSQFTPGEMVEVQILKVDKRAKKIGLGVKQLQDNPLEIFKFKHPAGTRTTGKVTRLEDFGAFVELAPGIEGLVHISQLADKRVEKVSDVLKAGDTVNVKIIDMNTDTGKISLSIKDYDRESETELINQHKGDEKGTFRLGDVIDLSKLQ